MLSLWQQPEVVVAFVSACIGGIIWLVRLEGRITLHREIAKTALEEQKLSLALAHKLIEESKAKHTEMESRIFQDMSAIKVALAEISGYLRKQKEIE